MLSLQEKSSASYDYVLIGSSPSCLLEAYFLSKNENNKRIVIIEKSNFLGGAWVPINIFNNVFDNGPHILYNFNSDISKYLNFISSRFDVDISPMKPQPRSDSPVMGMHFIESSLGFDRTTNYSIPHKIIKILYHKMIYNIFHSSSIDYRYINGGARVLINSIEKQLINKEVDIFKKTYVSEISILDENIEIKTTAGKSIKGKKLITTSRLEGIDFTIDGKPIELLQEKENILCIYIQISSDNLVDFSYYKYNKHDLFFLSANITNTAKYIEKNIYTISIFTKHNVSKEKINSNYCMQELLKSKLIPNKSTLVSYELKEITVLRSSLEEVEKINKLKSTYHMIHCDNLMRSIIQQIIHHEIELNT